MADISKYLQDILSAVYGEEVRGSIHDAIEIINDVSEVVLTTGTAVSDPTSSSEGFFTDSIYLNISTMELWKCIGTNSWQSLGVLKGSDGSGITSVTKTGTSGLIDTYTISFDDGHTETFDITNGADGADGKNGSVWYKGTALSGTGTSITGFPGNKNDFYLNSTDGYVYTCVKTGGAMLPDAAEWDYVMTLTGGGGSSVTVIDNLTSTSSTDALSANQGRVLEGKKQEKFASYSAGLKEEMVGPAGSQVLQLSLDLLAGSNISLQERNGAVEISAQTGQGGSSTFAGLDDTNISNPQADQIVQYKSVGGQMKLQNVNMPQGGHTMLPTPSASVDLTAIKTAIAGAVTEGGTNDDVPSLNTIGLWSNTLTKTYIVLGSDGSIGNSGIGVWSEDGSDETGWITISDLANVASNDDIDVKITFDPECSGPIALGGYIIDTTTSKMCIKFANEISDADKATARIGIEIIYKNSNKTIIGH